VKNIVIIGAGYGGLTAAALLAKEGHSITVIEKNEQPKSANPNIQGI